MLCFNVGGFLQACNVKNPHPGIVNNGEESPPDVINCTIFFAEKTERGTPILLRGSKIWVVEILIRTF